MWVYFEEIKFALLRYIVIVTRVMLKKEKVVERKGVIMIKYIYFSDDKPRLWKK